MRRRRTALPAQPLLVCPLHSSTICIYLSPQALEHSDYYFFAEEMQAWQLSGHRLSTVLLLRDTNTSDAQRLYSLPTQQLFKSPLFGLYVSSSKKIYRESRAAASTNATLEQGRSSHRARPCVLEALLGMNRAVLVTAKPTVKNKSSLQLIVIDAYNMLGVKLT